MDLFWFCKQLLEYLLPLCLEMQGSWRNAGLSLVHSMLFSSHLKAWLPEMWSSLRVVGELSLSARRMPVRTESVVGSSVATSSVFSP